MKDKKKFTPHLQAHRDYIDKCSQKNVYLTEYDQNISKNCDSKTKEKIDQTIRENRKEAQEARDQGKVSQHLKDYWNECSAPDQNVIPRNMHDVIELTQPIKLAGKVYSAVSSFFGE